MGRVPHLTGYLENHDSSTNGSFQICIAGGAGVFVQQAVYESIPEFHRPPLNTSQAITASDVIFGGGIETIGSTIRPFVLVDRFTGTSFGLKMHALVMPNLHLGMFIGYRNGILKDWGLSSGIWYFGLDLGNRRIVTVRDN